MMVIKKVVCAAVAALACCYSAPALAADEEGTAPMWGVRVGVDVMLPGNWHGNGVSEKMYKPGAGVTAGVVYNVYLGRGFYFEPGVSLFYDKYSYDDLVIPDEHGDIVGKDPTLYKAGVRVPLSVGYAFDVTERLPMVVYTGPELSYAFAGGCRVKGDQAKEQVEDLDLFSPFGKNGIHRRFDLAWKVGFGFPIGSFMVSVDAAIGVNDILRSDLSFRENKLTVGCTYYF